MLSKSTPSDVTHDWSPHCKARTDLASSWSAVQASNNEQTLVLDMMTMTSIRILSYQLLDMYIMFLISIHHDYIVDINLAGASSLCTFFSV